MKFPSEQPSSDEILLESWEHQRDALTNQMNLETHTQEQLLSHLQNYLASTSNDPILMWLKELFAHSLAEYASIVEERNRLNQKITAYRRQR